MTPERWQQLKDLLNAALELPVGERTRFLAGARVDGELRREVEALLALETRIGDFIETPAVDVHGGAGSGDRTGQRVGPWELVEEIGRGGMGTVYRARRADDVYDQTVALKVLKRGLDTDEVVRRFRAERQILAGLEHPNIARLLDGGTTDDGLPYLVMEYVDGLPIDVFCREAGLSVRQRLGLFLQVCTAVQLAHRNLVVHRDLKPSNILVTADGVPKLLDFGIAKLLDPSQGEGLMTLAGWQFLTPEYASPEQAAGGAVTTATDVYSLGVLLYQLLADRRPYELVDRTLDGLSRVLAAGGPPRPSSVAPPDRAPRLRGDLDDIAGMALRPEPEDRYATVEQLAGDVQRHLAGRPVRATPDTWRYRLGKFVRRNKLPVAAAAAFLALVVGFSIVTWIFAQQAVANERRAEANAARAEENAAEAKANAAEAEAVTDFLLTMIREIDPDNSQGQEPTVREAFAEGIDLLEKDETLAQYPESKATLLQAFAQVFQSLGSPERAKDLLLRAVELRRDAPESDPLTVAHTLNALAHAFWSLRDLDSAEDFLNQALDLHIANGGPRSQILRLQANLATLYERQDRKAEAEAQYRKLIPEWRRLEHRDELSRSLNNLGVLLYNVGRYKEAEPLLREALSIRRLKEEEPTAESLTASVLAHVLAALGKDEEAESLYRERIATETAVFDNNPRALPGINGLATFLHSRGRYGEAESLFRRGLAIQRASQEHPDYKAILLRNLAALELDLGRTESAGDHARSALAYWKATQPDGLRAALSRAVLGSVRAAQGRYPEAEELLVSAFESYSSNPHLTPDQVDFQDVRRRLVALYEDWGRPEVAARYRTMAVPSEERPELGVATAP